METMQKEERKLLGNTMREWIRSYRVLLSYAVSSIPEKSTLPDMLDELLSRQADPTDPFPEGYYEYMVESFVMAYAYGQEKSVRKLRRLTGERGETDARKILDVWVAHPLFWSAFFITDIHGDDLFTVIDIESGEERLIYSKGLSDLQKRKISSDVLYLSLLGYTGEHDCHLIYGPYHYYQFDDDDLIQWAMLINEDLFHEQGLSGCIMKHYREFFSIDRFMESPNITHRGELQERCFTLFEDCELDVDELPGNWEKREMEGRYVTKEYRGLSESERATIPINLDAFPGEKTLDEFWDPDTMRFPTIYYDRQEKQLALTALTLSGYQLLYALVRSIYPQWESDGEKLYPDWQYSIQLESIIQSDDTFSTPLTRFIAPYTNGKDDREETAGNPEELAQMNDLLGEIMSAHNRGDEFDSEDAAERYGMDPDQVESLVEAVMGSIGKMGSRFEVPEAERIHLLDLTEPAPEVKQKYALYLEESGLFVVDESHETERLFHTFTSSRYVSEVQEYGIPDLIGDLFFETFSESGGTVCNALFSMLLECGHEPRPVRSYAVTILSWFGHVILRDLDTDFDGFIELFSSFVARKLCQHGICELMQRPTRTDRQKGTFDVMSTEFFRAFVS